MDQKLFILLVFVISAFSQNLTIYQNIEFKGMTFVGDKYCPQVPFTSDDAKISMYKLAQTGANSVSVVVTEYQDTFNSTKIYPIYSDFPVKHYYTYKTETIEGLTDIINYAKELGLQIMLKPQLDMSQTGNVSVYWRGDIGIGMNESDVELWFISYTNMIVKYAKLAESLKVQILSVSCELQLMSKYTENWRDVIGAVRKVFSGKLTVAANYGPDVLNIKYWDDLDYIGVDAYYLPSDYKSYLSGGKLEKFYEPHLVKLEALSLKFKKEIIVTEIGFCSGSCDRGDIATISQQVNFGKIYLDFYEVFAKNSFIVGIFWWAWNSDPYYGGLEDVCLSPQYKFAEDVLRFIYQSTGEKTSLIPDGKPQCVCTH